VRPSGPKSDRRNLLRPRQLLAMVLVAVLMAQAPVAAGPAEVGSALAAIERPRNPLQLKNAYKSILKGASVGTLRELKKGKSLPLALGAAWRAALQESAGNRASPTMGTYAFSRFVGFVDGRLPVAIPEWWERMVAGAVLWSKDGDDVMIRCHPKSMAQAPNIPVVPDIPDEVVLPKGWSAEKVAAGLELRMPDKRVVIPITVPKKASRRETAGLYFSPYWSMLSAVIDGDSVFVVITEDEAYHSAIFAKVSRGAGQLLWERRIWTGGGLTSIAISGPSARARVVEPRIGRDGNVYVFGVTVFGAFIESFSASDGTPQLRFCTLALQEWF
jgi:hypothetical protein